MTNLFDIFHKNYTSSADFTLNDIIKIANSLAQLILDIAGMAAVIVIIWSGIKIITSGGNEESIKESKNSIKWTIIGLTIIILSKIIVHWTCQLLGVQNQCLL